MEIRFSTHNEQLTASQIDAEKGVIYGVALANKGLNKNGYYFSERFLNELKAYGEKEGKIKSRFEHPSFGTSDLGSLIGWFKNFRIENNNLYGDLFIADVAKKTQVMGRGISIADYVISMASECPDMFGNSVYVFADEVIEEVTEGGETKRFAGLSLDWWVASDLVDVPAATNGLFFSNKSKTKKVDYMNILERVKKAFDFSINKAFDLDLTLANGDIITVVTEAEKPQVGDKVKQKTDGGEDAEKPLADGEYVLKDESTLVVEGGAIKEIKEKASEPNPDDGNQEEFAKQLEECFSLVAEKIDALASEFAKIKSTQSRFSADDKGATSNESSVSGDGLDMDKMRKLLGRTK